MTPFKLFADSVIGSGLPTQFQHTRLWLTSFFSILCAILLIVSGLNVFQTTRTGLEDLRSQVRQELQRTFINVQPGPVPIPENNNPRPREEAIQNEVFERVMYVVLINDLVLLILLTFIIWVSLYFLLLPLARGVEEKSQFLSQASHELRTPLAILHSELSLSAQEVDVEVLRRTHQEALQEIKRLHQLSERLLGRIGGDQLSLDHQIVELKVLIQKAWDNLGSLNKRNLKLDLKIKDLSVESDPVLLYQLIFNLLENFLKHGNEDSTLEVDFDQEKNQLSFNNPTNQTQFSTGVGLGACKNMAKELGIELISKIDEKVYSVSLQF